MRKEVLDKLAVPYAKDPAVPVNERFERALGLGLSTVRRLAATIKGDFDTKVHGVGWWAPACPEPARVLIADHLRQCVDSVAINVIDAKVQSLELARGFDRENEYVVDCMKHVPGGHVEVKLAERARPLDDLSSRLVGMHLAGFFRAIASA